MKMMMILMFISFAFFSRSQAASTVFQCTSSIVIDQHETTTISMTVVRNNSTYASYLVGSDEKGPLVTKKQTISRQDIVKVHGVSEILKATKLNSYKVAKVDVYTAGNFEDDAAGVRAAQFMDNSGRVLAKGMFFGWGGPVSCK